MSSFPLSWTKVTKIFCNLTPVFFSASFASQLPHIRHKRAAPQAKHPFSSSPFFSEFRIPAMVLVNVRCRVLLFTTPWTVAHQAPLSMEFSRQYWSRFPFPTHGNNPNPSIKPESHASPALADGLSFFNHGHHLGSNGSLFLCIWSPLHLCKHSLDPPPTLLRILSHTALMKRLTLPMKFQSTHTFSIPHGT